ncbi:hypothetical protein NA78x_003327 [Anatilimnocola sp. NA78]|uniref:hypothetical protein n=1 Tax=Anatilimnocola sp. NA78 TaxID=3415683 RepID=UPI003CE50C1E
MNQSTSVATVESARKSTSSTNPIPKSHDLVILLCNVEKFLAKEDVRSALAALSHSKLNSPWVINAMGVCQLRQHNPKTAVDLFRSVVLTGGGIVFRNDIPLIFKTNYATALLAANNVGGCQAILAEVRESHPAADRLQAAIQQWKSRLTLKQTLGRYLGFEVSTPVVLDFPLGDLE